MTPTQIRMPDPRHSGPSTVAAIASLDSAGVLESADSRALKASAPQGHEGSSPSSRTTPAEPEAGGASPSPTAREV